MICDERQKKLAKNLVNYSVKVSAGDKVMINVFDGCGALAEALVKEVYAAGGQPFLHLVDRRLTRQLAMRATDEQLALMAQNEAALMAQMDCYIGIRSGNNSYEMSDVPEAQLRKYDSIYVNPVLEERLKKRWVILRYPSEGISQLAGMSTEAFEDYFFDVCCLDYAKMGKAMDPLVELMNKTDKVRIVAKDTDLSFSIKGIPAIKCAGECNIPDGEVYTAPVKDSVNGRIHYNVPSIESDFRFEDVCLQFENGKIVSISANDTARATALFDTDDGARYVGEFAIGVNPYVTKPIGDILFDEKISGSIHFTPGCCYDDAPNGNKSALHWDLVLCQTPAYGGGEIYFDGKLVRKDGIFVLPELLCLNPDNLK